MPFISGPSGSDDKISKEISTHDTKYIQIDQTFAKTVLSMYTKIVSQMGYHPVFFRGCGRPAFVFNDCLYVNTVIDANGTFTWYKYDINSMTYTKSSIVFGSEFRDSRAKSNSDLVYRYGTSYMSRIMYVIPIYRVDNERFWSVIAYASYDEEWFIGAVIIDYASNTYAKVGVNTNQQYTDSNQFQPMTVYNKDVYMYMYIKSGDAGLYKINTDNLAFTNIGIEESRLVGFMYATDGTLCAIASSSRSTAADAIIYIYAYNSSTGWEKSFDFSIEGSKPYWGNDSYDGRFTYPSDTNIFMYNVSTLVLSVVTEIDISNKSVSIKTAGKMPTYGESESSTLLIMDNNAVDYVLNNSIPATYHNGYGNDSYFMSGYEPPFILDFSNPGVSFLYPDFTDENRPPILVRFDERDLLKILNT